LHGIGSKAQIDMKVSEKNTVQHTNTRSSQLLALGMCEGATTCRIL